jgi:hypothetical protein
VYRVNAQLKAASENKAIGSDDKTKAQQLRSALHGAVEYAPIWVRLLSAVGGLPTKGRVRPNSTARPPISHPGNRRSAEPSGGAVAFCY